MARFKSDHKTWKSGRMGEREWKDGWMQGSRKHEEGIRLLMTADHQNEGQL